MFSIKKVVEEFAEKCTACGLCVECCPIIRDTDLKDADPRTVMEETLDLFQHKRVEPLARTRIYSCLFCNTCKDACPQGLYPGLSFGAAKGILQAMGDPAPKGVAAVLPRVQEMLNQSASTLDIDPGLIITDPAQHPGACRTILFSSCFGLLRPKALKTTLKILGRIDPTVKIFGGFDYCCGELQFMAGKPEEAERQFDRLIESLNALAPENVVVFCPTCYMNFDHHQPDTPWSRSFVTDFIADRLDQLSPLKRIDASVTIHDPCHYIRGIRPGTESPRKILSAIPGIRIFEMENTREKALCCGAYAITGTGKPGKAFRDRRMAQAKSTGADVLSLYCPGCEMILAPEGENHGLEVLSILALLGRSLGI
jgi:heterodisulfide reductase subunit D